MFHGRLTRNRPLLGWEEVHEYLAYVRWPHAYGRPVATQIGTCFQHNALSFHAGIRRRRLHGTPATHPFYRHLCDACWHHHRQYVSENAVVCCSHYIGRSVDRCRYVVDDRNETLELQRRR